MLKLGITGGIGSGKSTVARMFSILGVPVLNADDVARQLMEEDAHIREALTALFGKEVYQDGRLNRPFLSSKVFNDSGLLAKLNEVVHPAVIGYSREWMEQQASPIVMKEAALFFETGSHVDMDYMIGVWAPESLRVERAMSRDSVTEAQVKARMSQQMDEEEKMKRCDYVINNDESLSVIQQVASLYSNLLKLSAEPPAASREKTN